MIRHLVFAAALASLGFPAFASTVTKVKDDKIVMALDEGEIYQKDQKVKVLNAAGKPVAIALITLVKGNKAVATIQKGKAKEGLKAELTKASIAAAAASGPTPTDANTSVDRRYVGGIAGIMLDSADVSFTPSGGSKTNVSLSGMGFSAKGLYDMPLSRFYGVRFTSGIEQFITKGSNKTACGGTCEIKINYLSFDGWARFLFANSSYKPWAGVGLSILYPITKTSTTLDEGSIKPTSLFSFGGGVDYQLSSTSQIPIQLEYGFVPSSKEVKASVIAIRAGYSFVY